MTHIAGSSNTFRARYRADHDELEARFARLLSAFETNDRDVVAKLWNDFEERLVRHLEAEERLLVPQLFLSRPREAHTILEEHRHIRSRLTELGCAVDLHVIRVEAASGDLVSASKTKDSWRSCIAASRLSRLPWVESVMSR